MVALLAGMFAQVHAQTSVQVYGALDLGVEYVDKVGPSRGRLVRQQFGTIPSRLGFRGAEDLGGGMRATFNLEMGINADAGTLMNAGRAFGRTSTVGLAGSWGAVTVGRQLTFLFWSMVDTDTMGPGAYSSGALDAYLANIRADNSIAYRGNFGNFSVGALYSLGRDVANTNSPGGTNCPGELASDSKACRTLSVMFKYGTPEWGAAIGADRINGGPGAFGGLTSSGLTDMRTTVNGYYKVGDTKVTAGLLRRTNEGSSILRRSDLWWVGAGHTAGQWLFEAQLFGLDFENSANETTLLALRTTYFLSRRTALYATAGRVLNGGASAVAVSGFPGAANVAGGTQNGLMVGIRHSF